MRITVLFKIISQIGFYSPRRIYNDLSLVQELEEIIDSDRVFAETVEGQKGRAPRSCKIQIHPDS